MKNVNIKLLSNDELFTIYQDIRQQLLNAQIGAPEEMELDSLFTELSKEIVNRNIDLKAYKLADKQIKESNKSEKEVVNMKSVKNIVKGLLLSCVITVSCLVNGFGANASTLDKPIKDYYTLQDGSVKTVFNDNSFYINSNVQIQSVNKISNTFTFNKDGELYSFYVDDINNYYPSEVINVTMDNNNEVVDCIVDSQPIVYNNISIIYSDESVCCVRIGSDVYDFGNDDGSYKVNDKVNIVMQDDEILQVTPVE